NLSPRALDAVNEEQQRSFAAHRTNAALVCLQGILRQHGKTLKDFPNMPEPIAMDPVDEVDQLFQEEAAIEAPCREEVARMEQGLIQD
ncbi:hypothetical protein BGZ51_000393, partial [Haplosporangium sp. Z 767]